MSPIRTAAALVIVLALSGCRSIAVVPSAAPDGSAHDNLNATAWLQTAVEADMAHRQTWRAAEAALEEALADPSWDALTPADRVAPLAGLPSAVIVDVDETVLDNSPYQVRLIRAETEFVDPTWNAWVDEGRAGAVDGAAAFARAAAERGVTMIYLTNREHRTSAVTRRNLEALGFPAVKEAQFLGLGVETPGCASPGSDKGCRRQWVAKRYRVLLQLGDQLGDFLSITENSPQARAAQLAPFDAWVGRRWFLLANPSYGSWESALYDNDRSLSPQAKRAAKQARLQD